MQEKNNTKQTNLGTVKEITLFPMEISEIPQQYHEKLILNLIWFYRMIHGFWLKESKLVDYNLGISSLAKRCYLFCYILSNQKEALFFFLFF